MVKDKNIIKNHVFCYLSEVGHKNFHYPTNTKAILEKNVSYEILPWLTSDKSLQAIKVKNQNILYLTNAQNCANNCNTSVVWIEKDKLPLSSAG